MTKEELEMEIAEKEKDLAVFSQALHIMQDRLRESQESSQSRMPVHQWAGATGLVDISSVVVHNMEHLLDELRGEKPARPTLRVIEGGADGKAE